MRKFKSDVNGKYQESSTEELKKKIEELESHVEFLNNELFLRDIQKKSYAEIAFQYGKELNKSIGEVKFLEMVKELSVVKSKHNPMHETNIEYDEKNEELITNYLSNKKYEFQNEFLPLFLSGKITMIGNRDYMYWFEAIDDWIALSRNGNKEAVKNLIVCFENGYGVEKNTEYLGYLYSKLSGEEIQEPEFEEFYEINYSSRHQPVQSNEAEVFNVDKNNLEVNFFETQEFNDLKIECKDLCEQSSKIQTIYIKQLPSVERLVELSKKYSFLPYEVKNELFGSTIALHGSQITFITDNVKDYGTFLRRDKKADTYIKISNSSEWSCNLAVSIKDNLGNVFNSRCKVNPGSIAQINLFQQHPFRTKIESIIFKTLEQNPKTYIYQPKNWIVE